MPNGRAITTAALTMSALVVLGSAASAAPAPAPDLLQVAGTQATQLLGALDTGVAGGSKSVTLVLASQDEAGLDDYIAHPHAPLSTQEFQQRFGPSQQALDQVRGWADQHGLQVQHEPGTQVVHVTGPAQQVGQAFGTSIHTYRAGASTYSAASAPAQLPPGVAGVTASVVGLSASPKLHPVHAQAQPQPRVGHSPQDLQKLYGAPPGDTGAGQAVAILGSGDLQQVRKDLVQFEDQFRLPHVPLNEIPVDGGSKDTSNAAEWDLDTQYSSGMAPDLSRIDFYSTSSLDDKALVDAAARWVGDDTTRSASESLGECERDAANSGFLRSQDELMKRAAAQGQTLFASSGDSGSQCQEGAGEGVDFPASGQNVVSVGGTTAPGTDQKDQSAWKGSGGGISAVEPAAEYQRAVGGQFRGDKRPVPDVSLLADPVTGYDIVNNGVPQVIGGTSGGAPSWNGIWARAQQRADGHLGFGGPLLYDAPQSAFQDITRGSNGDYQAGDGYDYVTGRGTPDIADLLDHLE
jgi:subtilase family serine protease